VEEKEKEEEEKDIRRIIFSFDNENTQDEVRINISFCREYF
jgi:hypothetical protein